VNDKSEDPYSDGEVPADADFSDTHTETSDDGETTTTTTEHTESSTTTTSTE
jgi:hypothetical protein